MREIKGQKSDWGGHGTGRPAAPGTGCTGMQGSWWGLGCARRGDVDGLPRWGPRGQGRAQLSWRAGGEYLSRSNAHPLKGKSLLTFLLLRVVI